MNTKGITRILTLVSILVTGIALSSQASAHDVSKRHGDRDHAAYKQDYQHKVHGKRYQPRHMHHDRKWNRKWHKRNMHSHGQKHRHDHRYTTWSRHHYLPRPGYYHDDGRVGITFYYRSTL